MAEGVMMKKEGEQKEILRFRVLDGEDNEKVTSFFNYVAATRVSPVGVDC